MRLAGEGGKKEITMHLDRYARVQIIADDGTQILAYVWAYVPVDDFIPIAARDAPGIAAAPVLQRRGVTHVVTFVPESGEIFALFEIDGRFYDGAEFARTAGRERRELIVQILPDSFSRRSCRKHQ